MVCEPHECERDFPGYLADPSVRRRNVFAYIDVRDLAQMVERCLSVDGLGYQIFNVSNDDHSVDVASAALIDTYYQGVPADGIEPRKTFYSNEKAKKMLGFQPEHSWRMYLKS